MKTKLSTNLNSVFEAEENFEIDAVDVIINKLSMFQDISFSKKIETEDYIIITVNSNTPDKARNELSSYKFSSATNLIIEPIRKTKIGGYRLAVYDADGDPFDKDIYIQIRRGGEFNAGVKNEMTVFKVIQDGLDDGIDGFFFECGGEGVVVENVVSVRQCGSDAGSRMGNRADIELKTKNGTLHKFSLKKDSAYKVAGLVRKFADKKYKIGKVVRDWFRKKKLPFKDCYITVKITNEELYKWCWFGNDIDENGAVLVGDVDENNVNRYNNENLISINFSYVLEPSRFSSYMMDEHPAYFMVGVNKRGAVEVRAAVMGKFGRRYLVDDLIIPGINDESIIESEQIVESKPSDYGTYFFHGTKNKERILKWNPPSPKKHFVCQC